VLLLFRVWSVLELGRFVWWIWDFLAWIGLIGELHRHDRFRGTLTVYIRVKVQVDLEADKSPVVV
jgi:hypothetical protein